MKVSVSDERDSGWEDHYAVYRVYFFAPTPTSDEVYSVATFDLFECEVDEAIAWAEARTVDTQGLYAVALVSERQDGERGLIWLKGTDANSPARIEPAERAFLRMVTKPEA